MTLFHEAETGMQLYLKITKDRLALVLVFTITIFNVFTKIGVNKEVLFFALVYLGIYSFNRKEYVVSKISYVDLFLVLYLACVLYSSFINRNSLSFTQTFYSGILYSLLVFEDFCVIKIFARKHNLIEVYKTMFWLVTAICVVSDVTMFFTPIINGSGYFLGTKFNVSYVHMQMLIFYLLIMDNDKDKYEAEEQKKKEFKGIALYIFCLAVTLYVGCGTGVFGVVLIGVLYLINKYNLYSHPVVHVSIILSSIGFLFFHAYVLSNRVVMGIIVNIFHKQPTLTGRTTIYENLVPVLFEKPWWGYGYNSNFEVLYLGIGAVNSQNGFIKIIMETGVFSFVFLLLMLLFILKDLRYNKREGNPALLYILVLEALAFVEITIDKGFLFWMMLLYAGGTLSIKTD